MTQSGTGGYGGGADFHLPDEILAVIPTDPYEQLDLARKVTSMAIASRVSKLDLENGKLREKVAEKDRVIAELQDKLSQLDRMFQEADARLRVSLEENIKLSKERDSLAQTSKKLARDLAKMMKKFLQMNLQFSTTYVEVLKEKYLTENGLIQEHLHMVTKRQKTSSVEASFIRLEGCNPNISADCLLETFKRHLMQSLNDNNSSSQETVDIRTYDQSVAKASSWKEDEGTLSRPASNLISVSAEMGNMIQDAIKPAGSKFFISPQMTPHLTPTATPKIQSTSGSPRQHSTAGSPKLTSGATSPSKPRFEGHIAMSPWYPSSQQSSAASSPPRGRSMPGRTPRIDGKEFFRQARSRLSYEQFGAFLANIKELNAHKQSREETLKKAEEIFGRDNKDLYVSFQSLLNRSLR